MCLRYYKMDVKMKINAAITFLIWKYSFQITTCIRVCDTFGDYYFPNSTNCRDNPDAESNVTTMVKRWGFKTEERYLTTTDGYELLIVRIYSTITKSSPIIIGHGLFSNSLAFTNRGNKSLGFILGNLGYDVWLINFRGSKYSRTHTNLTADEAGYWRFSLYELGCIDLRQTIDFVHEETGEKAIYIGYSAGTTASFVYASTLRIEAKKRLKGIIALAPMAYFTHPSIFLQLFAPIFPIIKQHVIDYWNGEVLPQHLKSETICNPYPFQFFMCKTFKGPVFGFDYEQIDPVTIPVTSHLNSDSASFQVIEHFVQIYKSNKFRRFDFGRATNFRKYQHKVPPRFRLSKINVPVGFFVGENDPIANKMDARKAYNELPQKMRCGYTLAKHPKFDHEDFVAAKDVVELLYYKVVRKVSSFNKEKC